jgi:glyoxylase-like metal-dependent hydrolase (beta-lactamase superfamily II)
MAHNRGSEIMCVSSKGHHPHHHSHHEHHGEHGAEHAIGRQRPGAHNHDAGGSVSSRRDFLRMLMGTTLAGASVMELAYHRAAWARAAAPAVDNKLFDLEKAANGVFFAHARPQAQVNCNAAIFVRSKDVVVVDAHSKPSAAASLIAQIRREVTDKPVRYVINTHFHWDHTQGDHAYRAIFPHVDFIASNATKQLLEDLAVARVKASLDAVPPRIDGLRQREARSTSDAEKAFCKDQIRQLQAYQADVKDYTLELPTITFDKSYLLRDPAFDLHLEFHGRAHTAGDIFVFCPQANAVATGDASHGWLPNIGDGFPRMWPHTVDEVSRSEFKYILGGHGPLRSDRTIMTCQRNYIEELTEKVEAGKKAGLTPDQIEKRLTIASLKSMQSNGYESFLNETLAASNPHYGPMPPLQDGVNANIEDVYKNLDRV